MGVMKIMTDRVVIERNGTPLFIVPSGTRIDEDTEGRLLFCEPGKLPYRIEVEIGMGAPKVTKIPGERKTSSWAS